MKKIKGLAPLLKRLPIAILGSACASFLGAYFTPAQDPANPDPNAAVAYYAVGAIVGFLVFGGLAWWLEKMSGGEGVQEIADGLAERLKSKGFVTGNLGNSSSTRGSEGAIDLADRIIAQAFADRKEVLKYKDALGKYADSSLVQKLNLETSFSTVQTKKINMAVMFTDIRGFTKMSETLSVDDVVRILNDYFSIAATAVHSNNGRINKFIGDAVMAVFEDPPTI